MTIASAVALELRLTIVAIGVFAILAGAYWIMRRQGQPVNRWIILPIAIIAVGFGATTASIASYRTSNQQTTAQPTTGSNNSGGVDGADSGKQARQSDETPVSPEPSRQESAYKLTLSDDPKDPKRIGSKETYYKEGPLRIDAVTYERVLYNTPGCEYEGPVFEIYQTDRKYRKFQAKVGVGDDTPHEARVKFTVLADHIVRNSKIAVLGQQAIPFEADITGAFRIEIRTEIIITDNCNGKVYGAWIDPVIVP
jgi:hypothetical protein